MERHDNKGYIKCTVKKKLVIQLGGNFKSNNVDYS